MDCVSGLLTTRRDHIVFVIYCEKVMKLIVLIVVKLRFSVDAD